MKAARTCPGAETAQSTPAELCEAVYGVLIPLPFAGFSCMLVEKNVRPTEFQPYLLNNQKADNWTAQKLFIKSNF